MAEKKRRAATAAKDAGPGVSVRISAELRQRAKVYAALNSRSLMDVVDEAVAAYLQKRERGA